MFNLVGGVAGGVLGALSGSNGNGGQGGTAALSNDDGKAAKAEAKENRVDDRSTVAKVVDGAKAATANAADAFPAANPARDAVVPALVDNASITGGDATARRVAVEASVERAAADYGTTELAEAPELTDARQLAEAAAAEARRSVLIERVGTTADAPSLVAAKLGDADAPGLARDVATVRGIDAPAAQPAVDQRV